MKKKIFRNFSWIALALAMAVLGWLLLSEYLSHAESPVDYAHYSEGIALPASTPENDTAFGGIFMGNRAISDTLPHYQFQQKADSIKLIRDSLDWQNKSFVTGTHNAFIGWGFIRNDNVQNAGVAAIVDSIKRTWVQRTWQEIKKDTAETIRLAKEFDRKIDAAVIRFIDSLEKNGNTKFYITLPGYTLEDHNRFFVAGDRFYLTAVEWGPVQKNRFDSGRGGHYYRKQIPVRYAADSKQIMIPVSRSAYKTFLFAFRVTMVLVVLLVVYTMIGLPIQLLINISRGKAFVSKNISMMRFIAITIFSLSMIDILAPFLLRFFLSNYIPEEFHHESFASVLLDHFNWLFLSIVAFAVSIAFKKGYQLQQEQELTV